MEKKLIRIPVASYTRSHDDPPADEGRGDRADSCADRRYDRLRDERPDRDGSVGGSLRSVRVSDPTLHAERPRHHRRLLGRRDGPVARIQPAQLASYLDRADRRFGSRRSRKNVIRRVGKKSVQSGARGTGFPADLVSRSNDQLCDSVRSRLAVRSFDSGRDQRRDERRCLYRDRRCSAM